MTMTHDAPAKHDPRTHVDRSVCDHCLVPAPTDRSAKVAWTVAAIAVGLLIVVFFLGVGSAPGTLVAGSGFALVGMLLCPLVMGGMMWMMMRKGH
jgi:predicted phage tail protein